MNEDNNKKGRGVFYGVIGVATLVVAIIGATFAYFTAAQSAGGNVIGGNMANIGFNLSVEKVLDPSTAKGMIPMSNNMVDKAVSKETNPCTDDNGNAVCQIYKVTVTNTSTATMFIDGYVALTGGSGIPTDTTLTNNTNNTMRWAQVFENEGAYSTAGTQTLGANGTSGAMTYTSLDAKSDTTGFNTANIKTTSTDILGSTTISDTSYDAIKTNYIRISDHAITTSGTSPSIDLSTDFTRTADLTSMLVLNQQLGATGTAGGTQEYYFVVWLTETGHNQTPNATVTTPSATTNPAPENFFNGIVRFISAQGSEVTATFSGYTAVASDSASNTTTTTTNG